MKVLITAGGTTEPIDSVRSITNTSTGKLGSLIAESYDKNSDITKIYFVCGKNSILPKSAKTEVIFVSTVASLEKAVRKIIKEDTVDIIVHSMAVSDYRVEGIASVASLTKVLNSELIAYGDHQKLITTDYVRSILASSEVFANEDGKISSDIDDLILRMKKNPKIISLFQTIAPQTILVGFKLLDQVSHEELINTAYQLLIKNRCSFVLANDLRDIAPEHHIGFLVNGDQSCQCFETKEEIAAGIVAATMLKRSGMR